MIEQLRKEIEKLTKIASTHTADIENYRKQRVKLQNSIKEYENTLQALYKKIDATEYRIEEKQSYIKNIQEAIENILKTITTLEHLESLENASFAPVNKELKYSTTEQVLEVNEDEKKKKPLNENTLIEAFKELGIYKENKTIKEIINDTDCIQFTDLIKSMTIFCYESEHKIRNFLTKYIYIKGYGRFYRSI